MKLILQKTNDFNEVNKIIEILSTEINDNSTPYFIKENETIIIKYTDTEDQFSIKDISSKTIFNNSSETLILIDENDLISLGGGNSEADQAINFKILYTISLTQSGSNDPNMAFMGTNSFDAVASRTIGGVYLIQGIPYPFSKLTAQMMQTSGSGTNAVNITYIFNSASGGFSDLQINITNMSNVLTDLNSGLVIHIYAYD